MSRGPLLLVVALAAATPRAARAADPPRELVVFEAASLKDVFARLSTTFEKARPGVRVVFNAAGSQELRAQIEHGAAADVFASADLQQMKPLHDAKLVADAAVLTCNEPVVVTTPEAAATVKTFADLPLAQRIVVGTPEVPIGRYTNMILVKANLRLGEDFGKRVKAHVVSRELNVRQVLAKVALGEADAAIVYRSDVVATKAKLRVVEIPSEINVSAEYPIAALVAAPHPDLARAWIDLVASAPSIPVFRELGFSSCPHANVH
jgi:molybdate transport system substrate-binding protein